MKSFGLELTFIGKNGESFSFSEANKIFKKFAKELKPLNKESEKFGTYFYVKVDNFRISNWETPKGNKYILEVNNCPMRTIYYTDFMESEHIKKFIKEIFKIADKLGLAGKVYKREKNTLIEYPNGGGHIHVGMDLFPNDYNFLTKLCKFQENLYIDFANRPYIRWMFCQWFDNHNTKKALLGDRKAVLSFSQLNHTIYPRFQNIGKTMYPTYEFRFFNAISDVDELVLQVKFLNKWIEYLKNQQESIPVILHINDLTRFKNLRQSWKEISEFLKLINLNPKDYRRFFEENYKPRMRWGELA